MRGLTIVLAGADPAHLRTALGLAAAQAALGGPARLFLDTGAVPLLAGLPVEADHVAAGLPSLEELFDTALALGVRLTACQSGLALAGLDLSALDPRSEAGGLVGLLAQIGDDRLVAM